MLRFFQSLFGHPADPACCPAEVLQAAIERTVDVADPSLRALGGYKRRLRPAVLRSMNHVASLVTELTPPLVCRPDRYDADPRLRAFFISPDHLIQTLSRDANLIAYRRNAPTSAPTTALLVMEQRRRRVMGVGQMQEVLQPGVAQTTVSFSAHRLLELAPEETQTRHQLQSRGFDQLLGLALARLTLAASLRDELEQQTRLLQAKIGLLQRSNWGFGSSAATPPPDLEELESDLEAIETVYAGLGGSTDYLARNLEIVTEMLEQPEQHLQLQATTLVMDRMGILRRQVENDAWEVPLQVLHIGEEGERVVALVEV